MDDGVVSDIKRGRAARNAKLASIPVGFAARSALGFGKRLTGKSKDDVQAELLEKAAHQLAAAEDKQVLAGVILEPGDFFRQVASDDR